MDLTGLDKDILHGVNKGTEMQKVLDASEAVHAIFFYRGTISLVFANFLWHAFARICTFCMFF